MSVLDSIPEPIRSMVEQAAHELLHEREHGMDSNLDDSMKLARFIEDLSHTQVSDLRELIMVCGQEDKRVMLYGLATGAIIYKHNRNWRGESAEEELLGHHEAEVKKDSVDWEKHVESLPTEGERRAESAMDCESNLFIPSEDSGKWSGSEYDALCREYEVELDGKGNMKCTRCSVFVHSLTDRMLKEPGVEGCGSCQKKIKWG